MPFCGFPGGLDGKESSCDAGDMGSVSGLGRSPGEVNGNPLQHSYLENFMDRGAWRACHKELDTIEQLTHTHKASLFLPVNTGKHVNEVV